MCALLVQLVVLLAWSEQRASLHVALSVLSLVVLSFTSGIISTATFALMMKARGCTRPLCNVICRTYLVN